MVKVHHLDGSDYIINLYDYNNFIGTRKVYYHCGKYYVKYKGRFGEILDFNVSFNGSSVLLASVDVHELYFRK